MKKKKVTNVNKRFLGMYWGITAKNNWRWILVARGSRKMSDFQLLDLKNYGLLSKSNQPYLKRMNQLLIKQIEKDNF